ncbi:MAG: glycosyltransferase, partial [Candidatus Lokiarchaeota archaeon]
MQANHTEISVIIPTYNEERNIRKTLVAVSNQRISVPYEIIVVDGQSSDNTVKIAKEFATVLISPKKGKTFQLNYAAEKALGNLLFFLDADTIVDPHFLQKIYNKFKRDKTLLACSARFKYFDEKAIRFKIGSLKLTLTSYFFQNVFVHMWYFFKSLFGYPELSGCNITVRGEIFFKVGGFKQPPNSLGIDKVFSDSLLYFIKANNYGKIKTLNFTSVFTSGRHLTVKRSVKRIQQYHSQKDVY